MTAGKKNVTACYTAQSNFENESLERLRAMVANGDPSDLTSTGNALTDAASKIKSIADDLRGHVDRVAWSGEGADAFREWGHELSKESIKLSSYTATAGDHMLAAGQALSEAQKAIKPPSPLLTPATPKKTEAGRLLVEEPMRQEAITQMNRLASYYVTSKETIAQQEEPNFRPLPSGDDQRFVDERRYGSSGSSTRESVTGARAYEPSASGAGNGGSGTYTAPHTANAAHAVSAPHHASASPAGIDRTTSTGIDSTAPPALPDSATHAVSASPGSAPTTHQGSSVTPPVPFSPMGSQGAVRSGLPTGSRTGAGGPARSAAVGRPGGLAGPSRGRMGDGVIGGTPNRSGASTSAPRPPYGTAVGEERGPMTRGPMGTGGHAGGIGGGTSGGGQGAMGRRLASEPGGTIGGARATGARGGEFTPGGSGLVRGNQGAGMAPRNAAPAARGNRGASAARPDFLSEDEETWTAGRRNVVPPVIE
ncbi:hypothetical protein [Streptomyces sp. H27-D2]|uniref:hypothetical protein n=1 Tax=Streptomyces sp. H27-D2 TaxID=3046304 RepID=UPI002DBAE61A|nr:hypothetical protein [Streptomyces sp. H27-D2]MEC4019171.1 hypothetical protein [Streptomyces sp. H27-D2]